MLRVVGLSFMSGRRDGLGFVERGSWSRFFYIKFGVFNGCFFVKIFLFVSLGSDKEVGFLDGRNIKLLLRKLNFRFVL